jgi:RsiW-degrading membrane proteinase PrsW (M82 family)/ribosomal protein S18 acetylase RimI-like enzyme
MLLLALAVAPGLAICLYFFTRAIYNPEPIRYLLISFFFGMVAIVPAFIIEKGAFYYIPNNVVGIITSSFLVIALVEEFAKFFVVRTYCFSLKTFDEPLDGIIYSVFVSMGFATLENIAYVYTHGFQVAFARMLTSVPAHASFSAIMGYYIGKAKFDVVNRNKLLYTGLFTAILFHGAYDSFIFLSENRWIKRYISEFLLFTGAVFSLYYAFRLSRKLFRLHQVTSRQLFETTPMLTITKASPAEIELIRELSADIWPATYGSILSQEQINYMLEQMYSPHALQTQMDEGHEFIIVYNAGVPIGFASYSEIAPTVFKLHKIYILTLHQGRGMGRTVMEKVIEAVKEKGCTRLQLNVNRQNPAKIFYEKLGFVVIREEDIDIGHGYFMNDYIMEKSLVAPSHS